MKNEKTNKLFVINPEKPMKFSIIKGNMLNIKYNQLLKTIEKHGGLIKDYDAKDDDCIILSHISHLPKDVIGFKTKYIKHCVLQNKILNLQDYRISKFNKYSNNRNAALLLTVEHSNKCTFARKILLEDKCIHKAIRSAEEDLKIIQTLTSKGIEKKEK